MPRFRHRDFEFEVPDAWWKEAGMVGFKPSMPSYLPGAPAQDDHVVGVHLVGSLRRQDEGEAGRSPP